jgi:hypothetical protein
MARTTDNLLVALSDAGTEGHDPVHYMNVYTQVHTRLRELARLRAGRDR